MDAARRQFVRGRAANRCEYCLVPQDATPFIAFHVEHVVARQHIGDDRVENLALACDRCNAFKGTNLTSIDPVSGKFVPLFNPRQDRWAEHFRFEGGVIVGITAIGRATVRLLNMNAPHRVELREEWLEAGGDLA